MRIAGRRGAGLAAVVAAVGCCACFEAPIDEQVALEFRDDGSLEIAVTVEFLDGSGRSNEALRDRMAERRRALLEGSDDWERRFRPMEPDAERQGWEKEDGELKRFVHAATLGDPQRGLRRFFSDTSVGVFYERGGEDSELELTPGAPTRADRRQREHVRRELGRYSEAIADYIQASAALWDHLRRQPDRARPCLGALFGDLLPDEVREALDELDEDEDALIDELTDAMQPVAAILEVEKDEAYSLDELSRLVFDPFPAEIVVTVPGTVELFEGFERGDDGPLRIRPLGFWEAFVSLEGQWLSPDPLVAFARSSTSKTHIDLEAFLAKSRRVEGVPNPEVVEEALVERLQPASSYRVVWCSPSANDRED